MGERLAAGLRVRIFVILVLVLLPILGLVYIIVQQEERTLAQVALVQVQNLIDHLITDYTDGVEDTRRLLGSIARLPEIRAAGPGCRSVLAWYRDAYPTYLNLGVIDRQGFLVCSALPTVGRVNLGDRLYFRQVIATHQFAVGEYQIGRITQKATVNFGYPLFDSAGDVRAVLFAAFDLGALSRVTSGPVLPRGAVMTLVDREGVVLTRYPDPERWTGRRLPEAMVIDAIQSQRQSVIETQGPDGVRRLYRVASLRDLPGAGMLYASAGIPSISAAAQRYELLMRGVAGLTLLGLVAAWLAFGLLFVKPVEALVSAARRVGQGELSARSGVAYRTGELGQLAQAFDGMAEELQHREVERNASEQQILDQLQTLTALYAGARQLTLSLDPDDLARRIVRIFVEVLGGKAAWIGRVLPGGRIKRLADYPADAGLLEEVTARVAARWSESTAQEQGPSMHAIQSGFPAIVSDIAGDPALASWRDLLLRYGIASLASFPLTSRDETFGVLAVLSDNPAFFSAHRVELFSAFANQAAAALENARLHGETTDRLDQLESLSKIDLAISSSLDLKITLDVILDQVTARLRVDAADILLLRPPTRMLEYAAGRGFRETRMSGTRLRLGDQYAGRVASERRTLLIPDLRETQAISPQDAAPEHFLTYLVAREQFVSYAAAPLIAKGQVLGVLEVYHRTALDPEPTWIAFLEAVAGQAAIAVDNLTLFDNLQRSNRDLARAYDTTLEGLSRAMDLRDKETEGHTQRVTDLSVRLARAMGMREDQVVHLRRGALLHDIGKMGLSDAILFKPDVLTADEGTRMRRHPEHARDLLQPIEYLRPALAIPYAHHEKWDGSGYPQGLRGDQIPLEARIFAIVDVWDALTSDRPYRPAWSKEKALTYIREQSGKHFDPRATEEFVKMMGTEISASSD